MNKTFGMKPILVSLGLLIMAGPAMAELIEVTPGNNEGWFGRASNTGKIKLGIADDRGGTASLLLKTNNNDGQIVKVARIPLISIDNITSISWDVHPTDATNYAAPQLEYFSFARSGTLNYDTGANAAPTLNAWNSITVDMGSDMFWSTEFGGGDLRTLNQWKTELDGILMNYFQFGFGSTGASQGADSSNVDYLELNGDTWDFEGISALPGEPSKPIPTLSQWALILMALMLAGFAFNRRKHLS